MEDEIIRELRKIKDEIGKEHSYDVKRLGSYLQGKDGMRHKSKRHEQSRPEQPVTPAG
ncbi:hypothetical protein [Candidatus Electrothrix sp.]|uniref:hypothetical protein n=1 Tax=Candidatus Electrothrix sp. TaxID=2170559 RepID=UPI004055CC90